MQTRPYRASPGLRIAVLVACVAITACSTIRSGSHYDETADFSVYSSWSWIADDPYIPANGPMASPLSHQKIRDAIREQLLVKGYTYSPDRDQADFVVSYSIGSREKLRVSSYPVGYRGPWGWHVYGSRYYIHEYDAHSYTEGTLAVDIFDRKSRKPVWHGWAGKTITASDRKDPSDVIKRGVARLFETFPRSSEYLDADF